MIKLQAKTIKKIIFACSFMTEFNILFEIIFFILFLELDER